MFQSQSSQAKNYKIYICYISAECKVHVSKSKTETCTDGYSFMHAQYMYIHTVCLIF